jgi:hypothetical protein
MDAFDTTPRGLPPADKKAHHGPPSVRQRANEGRQVATSWRSLLSRGPRLARPLSPCVDGSWLASAFFTRAVVVGAAMCSAY